MNWLRYVLLAVCILSALAGYQKGLFQVKTASELGIIQPLK